MKCVAPLLLAALLAGCEPAVPAEADAKTLDCADGARQAMPTGVLLNNMWGKAAAGSGPWRQCLQSRMREGRTDYGWHWRWPSRDALYAYPEVLVGKSPWNETPTNDARFPRSIADTRSMTIEYDIESQGTNKKNLAIEFWLTDGATVQAELMIWVDESPGLIEKGDVPLATVEIDGARWVVFGKREWGDVSGGTGQKWTFITYHAVRPSTAGRLDAREFMQDAIDRGLVRDTQQIAGVELGNEIVSGSGSTWVRRFSIDVR